jgi:hypothetical protein
LSILSLLKRFCLRNSFSPAAFLRSSLTIQYLR